MLRDIAEAGENAIVIGNLLATGNWFSSRKCSTFSSLSCSCFKSLLRFGLMFDPNYCSTIAQFSMAHQQRNATLVFVGWYNARSTDWRCVRSRLRTKLEKRKCAKHFFSVFEGIYGDFTSFSMLGAFEGFVTIFLLKKS